MFKQPNFPLPVFEANQLKYWTGEEASADNFFPRIVQIESQWEDHTVLLRDPIGSPAVAPRIPNWEDGLDKCLRECHQELSLDLPEFAAKRQWWTNYIGAREQRSAGSVPTGLFKVAAASDIWNLPDLPRIPWNHRAQVTVVDAVAAGGSVAPHRRTMGSSAGAPERTVPQPREAVGGRGRGRGRGRGGRTARGAHAELEV